MAVDPYDPYRGIREAIEKMRAPMRAVEANRKMLDDVKRARESMMPAFDWDAIRRTTKPAVEPKQLRKLTQPMIDPEVMRKATQPIVDMERIRKIAQPVPIDIATTKWLDDIKADAATLATRSLSKQIEQLRQVPLIDYTNRDLALTAIAGAGATKFNATAAALEQIAALTKSTKDIPKFDFAQVPTMHDLVRESLAAVKGDHSRFAGAMAIATQNSAQLKLVRDSMRLSDVRELLRELDVEDAGLAEAIDDAVDAADPEAIGKLQAWLLEQIDGIRSFAGAKKDEFDQQVTAIKVWIIVWTVVQLAGATATTFAIANYGADKIDQIVQVIEAAGDEERKIDGEVQSAIVDQPAEQSHDELQAVPDALAQAAVLAAAVDADLPAANGFEAAARVAEEDSDPDLLTQ
ncbi:MAG: hypothetical protein KDC46_07560 [Thermoleophilia bacterium]|nr:hypothetical protein [Thermoleophilia bacterium]